jgi:hypothetical protein
MFHALISKIQVPVIVLAILISGCDKEEAARIAREAADRQAQQNTAMAELNKEVASGSRSLVAADAQARKEIVSVHGDLLAERARLDTGWGALEEERKKIAGQRRTESMLVPVTKLVGGLALVIALLGFCWYALVAAWRSDDTDAQLNELLICEILPAETPLLLSDQHAPPLLSQSQPDNQSAK